MGEFSYISYAALQARAMAALQAGVAQGAEHLVGEQQAQAGIVTGALRGSIHVAELVVAGLTVRARTATGGEASEYAIFHHEGTGPHHILPVTASALFWPGAAFPVAGVTHPGTSPNKYMEEPLIAIAPVYREFVRRSAAAAF